MTAGRREGRREGREGRKEKRKARREGERDNVPFPILLGQTLSNLVIKLLDFDHDSGVAADDVPLRAQVGVLEACQTLRGLREGRREGGRSECVSRYKDLKRGSVSSPSLDFSPSLPPSLPPYLVAASALLALAHEHPQNQVHGALPEGGGEGRREGGREGAWVMTNRETPETERERRRRDR